MFLKNIDAKIYKFRKLNKRNYVKGIVYHDNVEFIPGVKCQFNIWKSTNATYHINRWKKTTSVGTEKSLDKIQPSFFTKNKISEN